MAELNDLKKRILRSLCAETKEEEESARINHSRTTFSNLGFTGVFQQLLDITISFIQLHAGPPRTDSIVEHAERLKFREVVSLAREIAVLSPEWGSGYVSLLSHYREEIVSQSLRGVLIETSQILDSGFQLTPKDKPLQGVRDAIHHVVQRGVESHQYLDNSNRSIGSDIAEEALKAVFFKKKEQAQVVYGATGLKQIDDVTNGGHPGELWFIGGYAKHGKSTFALNWARHLAVEGGWNIYYVTMEMPSEDIWEVLYASHSVHDKWGRRPLKHREIVSGRFKNPEDEIHYLGRVAPDLNPAKNFGVGHIEVERPNGSMTVQTIRARAETLNRSRPIDMIVIDYLMLLDPPEGYKTRGIREITTENIKQAKNLSLEFDRGAGVLVVVPHQLSREGLKDADKNNGVYTLAAFAETAEVERSADQVVTVYLNEAMKANREITVCHLANRKGECATPFKAYALLESRYIGNLKIPGGDEFLKTELIGAKHGVK